MKRGPAKQKTIPHMAAELSTAHYSFNVRSTYFNVLTHGWNKAS